VVRNPPPMLSMAKSAASPPIRRLDSGLTGAGRAPELALERTLALSAAYARAPMALSPATTRNPAL